MSLIGLVLRSRQPEKVIRPHSVQKGRRLYDEHCARPRLVGGVKESTRKRHRAILDKFLPFLQTKGISEWNGITEKTLGEMVRHDYHPNDEESRRKMDQLDLLGEGDGRCGAGEAQDHPGVDGETVAASGQA